MALQLALLREVRFEWARERRISGGRVSAAMSSAIPQLQPPAARPSCRLAERAHDLTTARDVLLAGLPVEWVSRMTFYGSVDALLRSAQLQLLLRCTDQVAEALLQDEAWLAEGPQVRQSRQHGVLEPGALLDAAQWPL